MIYNRYSRFVFFSGQSLELVVVGHPGPLDMFAGRHFLLKGEY